MIKAVFFDIDGTLVSFKTHKIPASTLYAIECLKAKGIKVFIATGRPIPYLDIVSEVAFDGYVTTNGSHCFTPQGECIYEQPILQEDIDRLLQWPKLGDTPFQFVCDGLHFITRVDDNVRFVADYLAVQIPPVMPVENAAGKKIYQMLAYLSEEAQKELLESVLIHCQEMRWCPYFTDLIKASNSKSRGIDKVLDYYGIPLSQTMSFGDGGNDIQMLKHTAVGVAMGNANDTVKAAADYVTTSVDDDGVLLALKHYGVFYDIF